ncbi:MAG: LptF/LptG family permease [Elusimicrobiota bacterium]
MTKISRYFLKEFLKPLLFSLGALVILILVAELLEHLDKFIAGKAGVAVVAQYLLCLLPMRFTEILPVAVLLATLFSLGGLSRRQEITAAMSGGLHPWTCVRPLLACGFLLSLLSWGLSEGVIPAANQRAKALWKMDIRRFASLRQTRFDRLTVAGRDGFYAIGLLDVDEGRMENVAVDIFAKGRPASQIQAKQAVWREGAWIFEDGVERIYGAGGLDLTEQRPFEKLTPALAETPESLVPQEPDAEEMSYEEFRRHIRRLRALGVPVKRQEVELQMKLAFPWTSFIVLLLGIPFAFQKAGGKVRAVGTALAVAFFYFGLMQVGRALGQKPWFPPVAGAWLANGIFLAVGGWLFLRMRKLS